MSKKGGSERVDWMGRGRESVAMLDRIVTATRKGVYARRHDGRTLRPHLDSFAIMCSSLL